MEKMEKKLTTLVGDFLSEYAKDEDWKRLEEVIGASENQGVDRSSMLKYVVRKHMREHVCTSLTEEAIEDHNVLFPENTPGFEKFVRHCQQSLQLMLKLLDVCNDVVELCRAFLPEEVGLVVGGNSRKAERYSLTGFDSAGRAIYERATFGSSPPLLESYLRWCDFGQGGRWVVGTDREGTKEGKWRLQSALVTDAGVWEPVERSELEPAGEVPSVSIASFGRQLVSQVQIKELREEAVYRGGAGGEAANHTVKEIANQLCCTLAGNFKEDPELVECALKLLDSLMHIASMLGLTLPSGPADDKSSHADDKPPRITRSSTMLGHHEDKPPRASRRVTVLGHGEDKPMQFFRALVHLSRLADNEVLNALKQQLPTYDEEEEDKGLLAQCMTLNCRLLELSDLHNVRETFLPRLFHRFCLFAWQQMHPKQAMYLDLEGCTTSLTEDEDGQRLADKTDREVRFVVVSDTHSWDSDLELPEGDVLLHCGNLLFQSGHVGEGGEIANDLQAAMQLFKTNRYKKFQWIFMVGGNHDQPVFDLWRWEEERLFQLLPDNLVLLQAHTDFGAEGQLRCSGAAKCEKHRSCVQDGAVWLQPTRQQHGSGPSVKLVLRKPEDKQETDHGWVIAGTGVSLAQSQWSANRAFQLVRPGDCQAAKALLSRSPYIVMSHGPPAVPNEEAHSSEASSSALPTGQSDEVQRDKDKDDSVGDALLWEELQRCDSWKLVLCGHRLQHHGLAHTQGKRLVVDAAISTPLYVPSRPPIVFDLTVARDQLERCKSEVQDVQQCWQWWQERACAMSKGLQKPSLPLNRFRPAQLRCFSCCCWEDDEEELLAGWVPKEFVDEKVIEILKEEQERAEEAGVHKKVQLSDFHVAGPALLFSFQTVVHWGIALVLTILAVQFTGNPTAYVLGQSKPRDECLSVHSRSRVGCDAFVEYPAWLWVFFIPMFFHTWRVEMKCLSYMILPQVHALGRGFTLFGLPVSFRFWLCLMFVWSAISLTDVTAQCLFYAQFSVSLALNPEIFRLWEVTMQQSWLRPAPVVSNISHFFTACWVMTFLQAVFMLLHIFPTHDEGVSYACKSMPQGYTTLASHISFGVVDYELDSATAPRPLRGLTLQNLPSWRTTRSAWRDSLSSVSLDSVSSRVRSLGKVRTWQGLLCSRDKSKLRKYWHADILRTQAYYGRMPALVWEESSLMRVRVQKELEKRNLVRYLQILFHRQHDFLFRLILLDIMEKALKLEVQISVFALDLALQPDQRSKWKVANRQMLFAIAVTFVSVFYALYTHVFVLVFLWRVTYNPNDMQFLNREEGARNLKRFQNWRGYYSGSFIVLVGFVLHCGRKLYMAFHCEFSLYNFGGCVELASRGPIYNRTLILPDG